MTKDIRIDCGKCCYCGGCVGICPENALMLKDTKLEVNRELCTLCRDCIIFCPVDAITLPPEGIFLQKPEIGNFHFDVVIVGAGPAGSICAKYLAQSGARVCVVEKKQEIGAPKRCAEAFIIEVFDKLGITPDPLWLIHNVQAAFIYAPNGSRIKLMSQNEKMSGCIVERKIFDKHLAKDAIQAGAKYWLKTTATRVLKENGCVKGVVVDQMGTEKQILAKITIAADGVDSKIAKSAGLNTVNSLGSYMSCFQYEMAGLSHVDEKAMHLFFGNSVAPGGYVWIFPKGNSIANVGTAINTIKEGEKAAKNYLDEFIESHPIIFKGASPIEINCGGVPVSQAVDTLVGHGLMVIGDAGQLVSPITGGGLDLAMISGKLAAETALESLHKKNVRWESLVSYQKKWDSLYGNKLKRMLRIQKFMDNLTDQDFNKLGEILDSKIIEELAMGQYSGFLKLVLKKMPSLMHFAVKFLKTNV